MTLPARLSAIAASISQCFELPADEAAGFVRRSQPAFEALLAGGAGNGGGTAPPTGNMPSGGGGGGGGSGASASPSALGSAAHLLVYYQPRMRKAEVRCARCARCCRLHRRACCTPPLLPACLLAPAASAGRRVRLWRGRAAPAPDGRRRRAAAGQGRLLPAHGRGGAGH